MGQLWCPDGEHEVKVRFNGPAGERFCPEHGCGLRKLPKSRQPKHKQGLPGAKAAEAHFRPGLAMTQLRRRLIRRKSVSENR